MEPRISYAKIAPGVSRAMLGLEAYVNNCGLERSLLDLVRLHACDFALDYADSLLRRHRAEVHGQHHVEREVRHRSEEFVV